MRFLSLITYHSERSAVIAIKATLMGLVAGALLSLLIPKRRDWTLTFFQGALVLLACWYHSVNCAAIVFTLQRIASWEQATWGPILWLLFRLAAVYYFLSDAFVLVRAR